MLPGIICTIKIGRLCRCSCLSRGINACILIFPAAGSCWMPSGWFSHPPGTPGTASAHTEICKTFFFWCQHYCSGKVEILHWITSSPKCDLVSLTTTSSLSHKWNAGRLKGDILPDSSIPWRQPFLCMPTSSTSFSFSHCSVTPWRTSIHMHSVSPVCCSPYSRTFAINVSSISALYTSIKKIIVMFLVFFPFHIMWLHV